MLCSTRLLMWVLGNLNPALHACKPGSSWFKPSPGRSALTLDSCTQVSCGSMLLLFRHVGAQSKWGQPE